MVGTSDVARTASLLNLGVRRQRAPLFGPGPAHYAPGESIAPVQEFRMSIAAKQSLREAVERLPDDATVEDARERPYLLAKVARGVDAADRGDVVSHEEEARRRVLGVADDARG